MELNKAQRQAVEYLNGPLLVLAGPGTGKTQLLSKKVEYILKNTDTNPENILCITFTESGTTNMRNRLASIIGKDAHKVNISTYHAFGIDLLYRYQQYSADFNRKLDAVIDEVTNYKIIKNILEDLPPRDILKKDNIKDVIATISEIKSARLTPEDIAKIAKHNIDQSASLNAAIAPVLAQTTGKTLKLDPALENVYYPISEIIASHTSSEQIANSVYSTANHLLYTLKQAIDNAQNPEKPSVSPLTKWRNSYFELDSNGDWRLKNVIANKKLTSLVTVLEKYQTHLEDNGLYDYNDMIELAIEVLKTDRGFQLSMSEHFQYILLDEFQDTNPAQFELIHLLTDYEKPSIMAVGDDDQAIYAFQGANASNLLDFQNHYQAEVIVLTENYRSTQDILNLSRAVADQLEDSFAKNRNIDKNLQAKNPKKPSAEVTRHRFIAADAEYHWVAEKIDSLIKDGIDPTEIAIIAPKHKYLIPLLPHLKEYNINVAYEKRDNIFDDPAINQLIKLSRFIYEIANEQPASHLALEILAFPFWELNPIDTITIAHEAKRQKRKMLEVLAHSENEKIQTIANFIATLVQVSYDIPLELFLDYLIGTATIPEQPTSPFLSYYKNHRDETEIYELYNHLNTLTKALQDHSNKQQSKLTDFINFINDCEDANYALTSTSPYQNSTAAVQLLSGHKAKGLEFEYVFLIAVDDNAWGNSKGNNNLLSLPKNLEHIRHTGHTEDECIRLFFVAITRAKAHLIMTSSSADFSGKTVKTLQYLNEYEKDGQLISPYLPQNSQQIINHAEEYTKDQIEQRLHQNWTAVYQKLDTNLKDLLLKHIENYRLTASDLTTFIDLEYAGPQTFYERKVLNAPQEPTSPQISFGNVIHAVFEKVTKEKIDDNAALEFYEKRLDEESLTTKDREELLAKGRHALTISLAKFGNLLRADNAFSEIDFYKEHLQIDNLLITGKIDHFQIDKETKTIKIYDFKTGGHHKPQVKKGWVGELTLFKYSLQLEFYKLLLNLSPTYRQYQVTEGHILFVSPDNDDQVYDETYYFTDESSQKFLELAKAVYRHIMSLDFLENPDLNPASDKQATMKDIENFITLLLA